MTALNIRNHATTLVPKPGEKEDKENVVMFRTKQQTLAAGTGLKMGPGTGHSVLGSSRLALGNLINVNRNRVPTSAKDDQKKITEFGAIRKQGYGSSLQTRLSAKPEPRPPIHPIPSSIQPIARTTSSEGASKPLTRAAVRATEHPQPDLQSRTDDLEVENVDDALEEMVSADRGEIVRGSYSTAMIVDIDEGDEDDPQLAADYVNDIYNYLRFLEREQRVNEDYLSEQKDVTGKMRAILVDWLIQVHLRFHLLPETMYMTVMLLDRFLQKAKVPKDKLQLVGVSAMFLSSKYEEMYAPEIGDFEYITDHSYTIQEIRLMEIKILTTLNFEIGRPLPIHFLRRFSKAADADSDLHSMGKYFMEVTLSDYSMAHFLPSVLAASALYLSLTLLHNEKWSETLIHYSRYTESELKCCIRRMARFVHKTHTEKVKQQSVRNKYSTSKFLHISKHPKLNLDRLQMISEGQF